MKLFAEYILNSLDNKKNSKEERSKGVTPKGCDEKTPSLLNSLDNIKIPRRKGGKEWHPKGVMKNSFTPKLLS